MRQIPVEADQALHILRQCFGDSLVAAYLHGSAVAGGLRPDSDVDVLAVIEQPMRRAVRERLAGALLRVSGRYPAARSGPSPLELVVFQRGDISAFVYPARSEFVYGEWLRETFEAGKIPESVSDPELTLLLAQARLEAVSLTGLCSAELLPLIPQADVRRAIGDMLPALLGTLEGDERNVLLTLARMWRTLETGEFVPKDAAAEWVMTKLAAEAAALMGCARDAYLGILVDDWRNRAQEARRVADDLSRHVAAML